jgi:ribosome-binding ATPase YchF (GTP1/OBG family)
LKEHLGAGKSARTFPFDEGDEAQKAVLREMGLLSAKPIIYACNMDDDGVMDPEANGYYQSVRKRAEAEGAQVIPICARTEEDLAGMDEEEREMFMEELGLSDSGLNRLIKASYALLGLISFLTDGKKECRAWTIRRGTKAPQAAGKIHSDFERGFIRAQVIAFDTLKECGFDYAAVKAKGLQRTEGKEYVVKDGDIIEFLFNV